MIQPLAMKILIAQKIRDPVHGYENLVTINKIILKAKSTFIHLSTAEQKDQLFTQKFIKEHQFNEFIPDIIQFCTMEVPSVLHTNAMEIIHSYLCASLTQTDGQNIYRQSVTQILTSLGVMNMSNKPIHKILSDCASLHLKEVDQSKTQEKAEDFELACNAKFIPEATAKDPNFLDMFLEVVYIIMTNFKNVSRGNISELLKLLDALPRGGVYVFKLNQVAKATRILYSILKNNFEEFSAVDRTITRLIAEIKLILKAEIKESLSLENWVYIQCPEEPVHKSHRQELVRVLFRLLNSSIFKDDPNQGNFVSNSRKILYSELFPTCLELFEENTEKNSVSHDVVFVSCMHLLALVLNDLPAQIYKACDTILPSLFKSLEARIPNYNGFYLALLKLMNAVAVHERGKECLKNSKLIEKVFKVPVEPNYGYHFVNCEKAYEYNMYLRDFIRNDEDIRNRAVAQLKDNIDYLIEETQQFAIEFFKLNSEQRENSPKADKDIIIKRRNLTDQIDSYFNLISYIIIEVSGGFQGRVIERSVCTADMFKKINELFRIPHVADILSKDNVIYREVFKTFIHEHPELLKIVLESLNESLSEIEVILGPLEEAETYAPNPSKIKEVETLKEVTKENIHCLNHAYSNEEKLKYLYCLVRNYCNIVKTSSKKIDTFLDYDISQTVIKIAALRKAIFIGGTVSYEERLKEDFNQHKEAIEAFDKKAQAQNNLPLQDREEPDLKEVIGELSRDEYQKKFALVQDNNYATANFAGVLDFDDNKRSILEKEAEICQSDTFRLMQLCWKRKILNHSTAKGKKNIAAIVKSIIGMSTMIDRDSLYKTFDPEDPEFKNLDQERLMAQLVKFNQVVEEYTKLMASDSPYITQFYMQKGFKNVFTLYHWLRAVNPKLDQLPNKRILLSKHVQLLWSNIGDFFATIIECKFRKEAREEYSLKTDKHENDQTFLCSVYYHICSEVFKQSDIITYFLTHSKFFLECLIDIMKLLLSEENIKKVPPPAARDQHPFGRAFGMGRERPRREFDDATIQQLTMIGFPRRLAIEALNRTGGNVELSAEYLLGLSQNIVDEARNEENKQNEQKDDEKMDEQEEQIKEKEDDMDVDNDSDIVVCKPDELQAATKDWLKMLFNWILKGFNSSLTDIDVENITQFILKYISNEEDVSVIMNASMECLTEMKGYLTSDSGDITNEAYQKQRKSCLKKASTLTNILSHLGKYYLNNSDFICSLMKLLNELFSTAGTKALNFIPKEKEYKQPETTDVENPKIESEIFTDIVGN